MSRKALMRHSVAIITALLVLSGCSSVPERIREAPSKAPSLTLVRTAPESHKGAIVRWGGSIARVENRQHETRIEIVARPLFSDGEPKKADTSEGRFIARIDSFLDPAIYASGRHITIRGTVVGVIEQQLDEMRYRYPLLDAEAYYLWPKVVEREVPYDPWFYDPWYPWYPSPWHRYPYYY